MGSFALLTGAGTSDPYDTGAGARSAFAAYDDGGSGTRDSHWRETVFQGELMTGWISGSSQPLSRTTAATLGDLGHAVDLDRADAFSEMGRPVAP